MPITNAALAESMNDLLTYWLSFQTEYANWLGGTVGGGAGADGKYPLTNFGGVETLVKCPAQLQDDVDGMVSSASSYATAASASATAAAASATTATTQAGLADTARIAAQTAQTAAETAESSAVNAAVTATAQAAAAAASAASIDYTWASITGKPSTVSQAEAEAGTATTDRLWTAERVSQAIVALGGGGGGGGDGALMWMGL